ncbi:MAG: hypothetical protein M1830_005471 [Pleopsidium flavum]|nr:MAG: hypothetical protein M1830_005471 [Pleopsidium flavum]
MASREDLEKYIQSSLFARFFEDQCASIIKPAQDEAQKTGKPSSGGEKGGACKYSARRPAKRGWKAIDHYAFFLFCVREENMRSNEGIFYGMGLSDTDIDNRVWQILRRVAFDLSPSRKGNSKEASLLAASPESKPLSPVPVKVSRAPSAKAAPAIETPQTRDLRAPPWCKLRQARPLQLPVPSSLLQARQLPVP